MEFLSRLKEISAQYEKLEQELSRPEVYSDPERYQALYQRQSELRPIVESWREYQELLKEIEENQMILKGDDPELKELAEQELEQLSTRKAELEEKIKELLIPPDPDEEKNAILEIRAGAGGEEAGLFARDLFEMYQKWVSKKGFKLRVASFHPTDLGGFKEIICEVEGKGAYGWLKYESGVHRVQRIPITESGGRIHTSTASVAVLPEAEEVEVEINEEKDLRIDVFRAQGPGGQGVNTTDSAVRITHLPTGLVVVCQDERSQHKNKARALKILKSRLLEMEKQKQRTERDGMRRSQIGSGDRAEKIRTYNFPQNRITDHRINLTLYKLDKIMEGDLDELVEALRAEEKAKKLAEMEEETLARARS